MKWNSGALTQMEAEHWKNLEKAAVTLVNEVKTSLNTGQSYTIFHGKKGIWYKGLNPSDPGQPPHKLRGDLQRSITYEKVSDGVVVGTNISYAPYLEYGTAKMEARPFLLPALNKLKQRLLDIIAGK